MTSQEPLQNGLTLRYFLSCRGNAHYDRGATQTPPQASRLIMSEVILSYPDIPRMLVSRKWLPYILILILMGLLQGRPGPPPPVIR
ncbi:hypothetical protein BDV30DRAFT_209273 [Aspergillus minisclerotigenes]|uniref:Uncharacterized protein n=1 Tax=Aspergillus minisclerotigenes TaxID=656917 RepID=A0A5N6J7U8_9EURO|nr:hypothetical protein BDV30DRAFT_209273 [Aspergillus minisclerotigenes]